MRFDGRESLVKKMHSTWGRVRECLRKRPRFLGGVAFVATHVEGQPDDEIRDRVVFNHRKNLAHRTLAVTSIERVARMGHEPELVLHGDADAPVTDVDAQGPLFSSRLHHGTLPNAERGQGKRARAERLLTCIHRHGASC